MSDNMLLRLMRCLFPDRCECCGCRMAYGEVLMCTACMARLPRRSDSLSPCDNDMVRLLWGRAAVERGMAWVDYVPHSDFANVIYSMKYHDRPDIALQLGRLIATEAAPRGFFDGIDLIVPLPLHPVRERQRGYNQSREIAAGLSAVSGVPIANGIVERTRNTTSQTLVGHMMRAENMAGAFSLVCPERVSGRHVLIVDDIITTGASLAACLGVFSGVPDVRLSVLTVGKTVE